MLLMNALSGEGGCFKLPDVDMKGGCCRPPVPMMQWAIAAFGGV